MARLTERLQDRIRTGGAMRFRDWMEACLYDPEGGYYMRPGRKTGPGPDADFATSPTLSPLLARAVAEEVRQAWSALGRPAPFHVVEYGGGEGDLARHALAHLDASEPTLGAVIRWLHAEVSPVHRTAQESPGGRIGPVDEMPDRFVGVVVAHEFVDALPFHWLESRKGGWAEVCVDLEGDRFVETYGIPSRWAIEAAPKRSVDEGQRVVAMAEAREWIRCVADRLRAGRVLVVDYGDLGRDLWVPERPGGTVRGFKDHALVDSVLDAPGEVDVTASVDFTQLRLWALEGGLEDEGLESQEAFLVRHGALEVLASAPRQTPEDAAAYLRMRQSLHPAGMGSVFKVQRFQAGLEADDEG